MIDVLTALIMQGVSADICPCGGASVGAPDWYTFDVLDYYVYTLCMPLVLQTYPAARRLRDAGRSQAYLLVPPAVCIGLVILDMLFMWGTLAYLTTAEPLSPNEGPGLFAGTAILAGLGILLSAALSAMGFLLFGLFRRKEPEEADETA